MVRHQLQGRHGHPAGNRVARVFPSSPASSERQRRGEHEPRFTPGQRVLVQGYELGVDRHGGFAAYARVPADWVVPLPEALTCRTAAIIGLAGCTALLSLRRLVHHGTTPDDGPILVTGASGGVGSAAVDLLAHAGFEVVASSGKTAEHDYLKEIGASRVVGREFTQDDGRTWVPSCGRASSTASAAGHWPKRSAPFATAARARQAGSPAGTTSPRRSTLHRARRRPVGDRHRGDAHSGAARTLERHGRRVPVQHCEAMVNEEIGLNGLTVGARPGPRCCGAGSHPRRPHRSLLEPPVVRRPRRPATP